MAQPNVAREPSMEEILASIRRIIESNDPTSEAADLRPMHEAYAEDEIEDAGFSPDAAANDPGMPVKPQAPALSDDASSAAGGERSLSLADVAARVRAASARHQEMAMQRPQPRFEEQAAAVAPEPVSFAAPVATLEPQVREEAAAPVLPMSDLRPSLDERPQPARPAALSFAPEPSFDPEPIELEDEPATTAEPETGMEAPRAPSLPVQMDGIAGLLSEAAGAQVAKSFGELAEVFDGLERRSVEDMASEMLRPMLQEWLDDNLPTIVERLVREEIERVARGPRR